MLTSLSTAIAVCPPPYCQKFEYRSTSEIQRYMDNVQIHPIHISHLKWMLHIETYKCVYSFIRSMSHVILQCSASNRTLLTIRCPSQGCHCLNESCLVEKDWCKPATSSNGDSCSLREHISTSGGVEGQKHSHIIKFYILRSRTYSC